MSQKINIRERRYNGVDYDIMHPETNINMVLDSSNNSVGEVEGALYGDGNGNIIGATISNPNLLDNPWFTVNQRGNVAFGLGVQYTVDRWQKFTQGTITVTDNGLSITPTATTAFVEFIQLTETSLGAAVEGKTLTFSLMTPDGTIYSQSGTVPTSGSFLSVAIQTGIFCEVHRTNTGSLKVDFIYNQAQTQTTFNIRAVKLEVGSISTLANDVAPDYGMELLKCQRYFVRLSYNTTYTMIASGIVVDTWVARFVLPLPTNLRALPTITVTGTLHYAIDGTEDVVSALVVHNVIQNNLSVSVTGTGFTKWKAASLFVQATQPVIIDISADL